MLGSWNPCSFMNSPGGRLVSAGLQMQGDDVMALAGEKRAVILMNWST